MITPTIFRKDTTHCECGGQIYSASGAIDHHPRCKVIKANVEASRRERLKAHNETNRKIKAANKLRAQGKCSVCKKLSENGFDHWDCELGIAEPLRIEHERLQNLEVRA